MKRLEAALALLAVCVAYTILGWSIAMSQVTHDHQAHWIVTNTGHQYMECR